VLDDGTKLATLREAIAHLAKIIPKAQRNLPQILTASDILTKVARSSSRIATIQALQRDRENVV
jgi:hypothetical protein